MLAGMLLGILFYRPIFQGLFSIADSSAKVMVQSATSSMANTSGGTDTVTVNKFSGGGQLKQVNSASKGVASKKLEVILGEADKWKMIALIAVMVLFVTMVYGPIAAFLVELFPTRIRYTSMSLPYHIGNGVFGGLVPFIATLVTTIPGTNHLSGLWYPIGVAALCFVIGILYLSNRLDEDVAD
jgi:MHS family proline/betaine transporter-like MFS transporter